MYEIVSERSLSGSGEAIFSVLLIVLNDQNHLFCIHNHPKNAADLFFCP